MRDDYHITRNAVHRYQVVKVEDKDGENYLDLKGFEGHEPTKVLHIQPHGFVSVPVKDAHLICVHLGHQYDLMVAIGGEHSEKKPKNLGEGNSAFYNADGSIMKMIKKDVSLEHEGDYSHKAKNSKTKVKENHEIEAKKFKIKCGNVTLTMDDKGVNIEGGEIKHNGKKIDHSHVHINSGGIGLGGPPQ
jgi:phage gp45-like